MHLVRRSNQSPTWLTGSVVLAATVMLAGCHVIPAGLSAIQMDSETIQRLVPLKPAVSPDGELADQSPVDSSEESRKSTGIVLKPLEPATTDPPSESATGSSAATPVVSAPRPGVVAAIHESGTPAITMNDSPVTPATSQATVPVPRSLVVPQTNTPYQVKSPGQVTAGNRPVMHPGPARQMPATAAHPASRSGATTPVQQQVTSFIDRGANTTFVRRTTANRSARNTSAARKTATRPAFVNRAAAYEGQPQRSAASQSFVGRSSASTSFAGRTNTHQPRPVASSAARVAMPYPAVPAPQRFAAAVTPAISATAAAAPATAAAAPTTYLLNVAPPPVPQRLTSPEPLATHSPAGLPHAVPTRPSVTGVGQHDGGMAGVINPASTAARTQPQSATIPPIVQGRIADHAPAARGAATDMAEPAPRGWLDRLRRRTERTEEKPAVVSQPPVNLQPVPEFLRARELEKQGQLIDAIGVYESLVRAGDQSVELSYRLAVAYDKAGRSELSLPFYERALAMQPNNVELLCDFGFRWYLIENPQQAEHFYRRALELAPGHSRTNNNLGMLLAQNQRFDEALQHFRMAGLTNEQAHHNVAAARQTNQSVQTAATGGRPLMR
jgi:hypothetical protein